MQGHSLSLPSQSATRDGFDLLSALATYEATSMRLVDTWCDVHVLSDFGRQVDEIRERVLGMPGLTVLGLQLVIAHCELSSALWQNASVGVSAKTLEEIRYRHQLAVGALRAAVIAFPQTLRLAPL